MNFIYHHKTILEPNQINTKPQTNVPSRITIVFKLLNLKHEHGRLKFFFFVCLHKDFGVAFSAYDCSGTVVLGKLIKHHICIKRKEQIKLYLCQASHKPNRHYRGSLN